MTSPSELSSLPATVELPSSHPDGIDISKLSSLPPFEENYSISLLDLYLLIIFLTFWLIVYYRAVLSPTTGTPHGFDSSTSISNLHSIPLCILAFLSLLHLIPESIPLCWSMSFFLVDLFDTIIRRDGMWFAHAVITLALNILTGRNARHRELRSLSKGFFSEGSTVSSFYICVLQLQVVCRSASILPTSHHCHIL